MSVRTAPRDCRDGAWCGVTLPTLEKVLLLVNPNSLCYSFSWWLLVFLHHRCGEQATSVFLLLTFTDLKTTEPVSPHPELLLIKAASSSGA